MDVRVHRPLSTLLQWRLVSQCLARIEEEIFTIVILQNASYLLALLALQMSKVSYVVAFRQVSVLFAAGMGVLFLESQWKNRITGALILTLGLVLIGLAK
jgi:uncharacterized membrane protein